MCFLPRNSKAHPMLQVLFSFQRFKQVCKNYQEELRGFAKCVLWNYLSTPYKHIADAQFQLGTEPFPNF